MMLCLERKVCYKQKSLKRVRPPPPSSSSSPPPRRKLGCSISAKIFIVLSVMSVYCIDFIHCGQPSPSAVSGLGKTAGSSSSGGGKDSSSRTSTGSSSLSSSGGEDSEPSNHNHHHSYHRHHRHSPYSPSGKPHSSSSSSYPSTSTYNTYPDYSSPLSFSNPDSYYEPRFYERPSREFSGRSTSYPALASAASSASQVGFGDTEYGGLALATGHGGGHHGGGHGHGHGDAYGQGHTTYYKTVNKIDQSSLGLLGLLGLLSLLSNVLMLLTTTARATTMGGGGGGMGMRRTEEIQYRKRRDTIMLLKIGDVDEQELARKSVVGHLSHLILPSLNVIGHAKDGRIPLNCTYQEICKTNKVLVQVFGVDEGRPVASVMSTAITKLLANKERVKGIRRRYNNVMMQNGTGAPLLFIEKLLSEAAHAGRDGKDCEIAYPTCAALSTRDDHDHDDRYVKDGTKRRGAPLQLPLLISPERASAIILGQQS